MTLVFTIVAAVFLPVAMCLVTIESVGSARKAPAKIQSKARR